MKYNGITDTQRVLAVEAIRNLKARYFRDLDTKNWTDLPALFAPDAVFDLRWVNSVQHPVTGEWTPAVAGDEQIFRGRGAIVEMIRNAIQGLHTIHKAYAPEIDVVSGTLARAVWPMEDILRHPTGEILLNGFGHYHETYENLGFSWQIKTSRLTRLYMSGGVLAVK